MLTCARWAFAVPGIASVTRHSTKHEDPIASQVERVSRRTVFTSNLPERNALGACTLPSRAPCWDRPSSALFPALPDGQATALRFPSLIFASPRTIPRSLRWMMFFASSFPARTSTSPKNTPLKSCPARRMEPRSHGGDLRAPAVIGKFLDASIEAASLLPTQEIKLRSGNGIEIFRRRFASNVIPGRERFLAAR